MPALISDPALLAAALDSLPFGIIIVDRSGVIISANSQLAALVRLPAEELAGRPVLLFVPTAGESSLSSGPREQVVCRRSTGEIFAAERTVTPMPDGNLLITLQEIPESLRQIEERYRLISENTVDVIWLWSLEKERCVFVTPSVRRMRGFSPEEAMEQSMEQKMPPESYRMVTRQLAQCVAAVESGDESGRIRSNELEYYCKDGSTIVTETVIRLISDEQAKVRFVLGISRDIRERKLAQQALQVAEEKYRKIFDGAIEGMFRTTAQGRPVAGNPAMAKMLGYDSIEELLTTVTDSAHQLWVDPCDHVRIMKLMQEHGNARNLECRLRRKDGQVIWVSVNSRRVMDANGEAYNDGFMEDITERKRMEDALRQSKERFSKAFLSSPASMSLHDADENGLILDVNEAFEQITGYSREEAIGRTPVELNLLVDPALAEEVGRRLLPAGRLRNLEHRFRTRTGEVRTGLLSLEVVELDGRRRAICTNIDITERKQAEERIGSLATAIEQAGEQIIITNLEGVIEYCNPAFEKITGYSKEEVLGQNPRVLKSGKQTPEFYQSLWKTISSGSVWIGRFINRRKNGAFYEEDATISPIRDASGKMTGYVAVKRDVSERIQLENQFRQAQKLESVGRLAGGVAHDFNNLLTVINGYSGLLAGKLNPYDPLWPYVDEIRKAGDRAAGLTRQLLAFSRKQVLEVRPLDLNLIVTDAERMLRRVIGEDIELVIALGPRLGMVKGDLDQIHQVIMNLVVNARDAMPDGGRLVIETTHAGLDETGAALHSDATPGNYVLMRITDTGSGMDEKTMESIFEPFFTTKEQGKGTGLGLSTVYGIVRQNGGWVEVSSELGVGTTFRIYLPRIDACATGTPEGPAAMSAHCGGETVLLVEDNEEVRKLVLAILQKHGYHVLEARNGAEAYILAKEYSGDIHLLLTDVVMPGMNGKELSERLQSVRPKIRVLFSSGYNSEAIEHRGVVERHVAYLPKPFTARELVAKVGEALMD